MAPFEKTVTHPDQDPDDILNQPVLKMVVLVDDLDLVDIANNLALDPPISVDRWVVWFKDPDDDDMRRRIPDLPPELKEIQAFSLSPMNKVSDIIYRKEKVDYVRVEHAYTKAGLPENNQ